MSNGEYMRKILMPAARTLATILMLVSLAMFGVLVKIALAGMPMRAWIFPLAILATAAVLMWLLTKRLLAMQLYLAAFALWLVTTGYYAYLSFR